MQAFQQNLSKLEAADTQVLGVSMDSPFSNKAWAQQIGVTFPLLSDWGGDITRNAIGRRRHRSEQGRGGVPGAEAGAVKRGHGALANRFEYRFVSGHGFSRAVRVSNG